MKEPIRATYKTTKREALSEILRSPKVKALAELRLASQARIKWAEPVPTSKRTAVAAERRRFQDQDIHRDTATEQQRIKSVERHNQQAAAMLQSKAVELIEAIDPFLELEPYAHDPSRFRIVSAPGTVPRTEKDFTGWMGSQTQHRWRPNLSPRNKYLFLVV